jgi:hypothetical protein
MKGTNAITSKMMNIAQQIREFAERRIEVLNECERGRSAESQWKKLVTVFKTWSDHWSNPWQGGFPA